MMENETSQYFIGVGNVFLNLTNLKALKEYQSLPGQEIEMIINAHVST